MKRFTFDMREINNNQGKTANLIELSGVIDPGSVDVLRNEIEQAVSEGAMKLAFDMGRLRYLCSTGADLLMRTGDDLRAHDGEVVVMNLQPKVRSVIEQLGHTGFFAEVANEEDAISVLYGGDRIPAYIRLKIKGEEKQKQDSPVSTPQPKAATQEKTTKTIVQCGSCEAKLAVTGSGTYRCPKCRAIISVKDGGKIETFPEKGKSVCEVTIPARQEYVEGLRSLMSITAVDAGVNGERLQEAVAAVERCACYMLENALEGGEKDKLHFLLESETGLIRVLLYASGKALNLEGKSLASVEGLEEASEKLDLFKYSPKENGNLFTLEKKA